MHEGRDDRLTGLAAEVAFFAILALFPALLAVTAALGFLDSIAGGDVAERAQTAVVDAFSRVLSEDASGTIEAVEQLFRQASPGLLTFGLLAAVWAASRGFSAVIVALDQVYALEERRSYAAQRLLAIGLSVGTVLVVALVLAMVVVGPLLGTGRDVADEIGAGSLFATFWNWTRWPLVVVVLIAWAATVFHLAPNHRTPWRWDLPGAVLTAVLWALLSLGLRAYLAFAPEANQVFGALGGALTVLLWLYLLALGVLIGGEVNAILAVRHGVAQVPRRRVRSPALWERLRAAITRRREGGDAG